MQKVKIRSGQLALFLSVALSATCFAQTAQEKFWTEYVEACSPSSLLNGHAKFLGPTNVYGPGTTFGTSGGTTNPIAQVTSYFPEGKAQSAIVSGGTASCSSTGTRTWDLKLGLPISFSGTSDAVTLGAALSHAKSISVSIDSVSIDSIPVADWEDAADRSDHTKHAYIDAVDGHSYLMDAAAGVQGIKITYTLNSALSASLTAQFQSKNVAIGSSTNPAQFKIDIGPDAQTVVLQATNKVYMLGQFLKINKIPPKDQGTRTTIGPTGQPQLSAVTPIHVNAEPVLNLHVALP